MRYSDDGKNKTSPADMAASLDFVARKRIPTPLQFLMLFGFNFILITLVYFLCRDSTLGFIACAFIILAASSTVTMLSIQRGRDMLMVTEFQNALFAAALGVNTMFCLILRRDGSVAYADRGFQSMYPQFERSAFHGLQEIIGISYLSREDSEKIWNAVHEFRAEQHIVTMRDADGLAHKVVLAIDPIRRPKDYFILRGRAFVEHRVE